MLLLLCHTPPHVHLVFAFGLYKLKEVAGVCIGVLVSIACMLASITGKCIVAMTCWSKCVVGVPNMPMCRSALWINVLLFHSRLLAAGIRNHPSQLDYKGNSWDGVCLAFFWGWWLYASVFSWIEHPFHWVLWGALYQPRVWWFLASCSANKVVYYCNVGVDWAQLLEQYI